MLWGFRQSFQNENQRPTGEVIAKNIKICLRCSVLKYFAGLFGQTDAHTDTRIVLIFHLGRLLRDVSYDLLPWDERQKTPWELGLNDTCSAQDSCRELKLVFKTFLFGRSSFNETSMSGDTIFCSSGGDALWDTNAYRGSGNRCLLEMIDDSPPVACTYMGHTLRMLAHFAWKRTKRQVLTQMSEVRMKQDRMLKD